MSEPSFENKTLGISQYVLDYINNLSAEENPVLTELRHFTTEHPQRKMQISREQGTILSFLLKSSGAVNALEIGVFTGYSALLTALNLPENGKLTAIDRSEEFTSVAKEYWRKAGVSGKIELLLGDAGEILDHLLTRNKIKYDFIFIDADKKNYISYYEKCLDLLSENGTIIIDNILWRGLVADETADDRITRQVREFNMHVASDRRVEMCIIPITDGMMLVRKK